MQWHQLDHMQTICTSLHWNVELSFYPLQYGLSAVQLRQIAVWGVDRLVPSESFENVREVVEHEDRLERRITVRLGFVVQVQTERRQDFGCNTSKLNTAYQDLRPDLHHILRFIIRLSQVYHRTDLAIVTYIVLRFLLGVYCMQIYKQNLRRSCDFARKSYPGKASRPS